MKMIEILAGIKAIHSTAKRYHWQCKGKGFNSDHLLFDRVAETFSEDDVDTLVEAWYMNNGRMVIDELNDLCACVVAGEGQKFSKAELDADPCINTKMNENLIKMIENFKHTLYTSEFGQGIKSKLDEIALKTDQILGLLKARDDFKRPLSETGYNAILSACFNEKGK